MNKSLLIIALSILGATGSCKKDPAAAQNSNQDVAKEDIIRIRTSYGDMFMWLYKETPNHRANFLKLTNDNFLDGSTFHRVIYDFVIQGGDPNSKDTDSTNDGYGGPGYTIAAEFISSLTHVYGAVGAARDNNPAKASNGSQFYIVTNKNGYHSLDNNYTVFGIVFSGMDHAVAISNAPKNASNRPYTNIVMDVDIVKFTLAELKDQFGFTPP